LRQQRPNAPACVVLDVRMPDLSGLDLQRGLSQAGIDIPIIFMTGHADVPMSVRAMKEGAFEFLTKPFSEQALLHAIGEAIQRDREAREKQAKLRELRGRYGSLTPREREVMTRVVAGKLNKQVAGELHTVEKTVKFHRAHIMKKMQAQSLADLVRMAARLEGL
jgi:FixJ family two-component response regulator